MQDIKTKAGDTYTDDKGWYCMCLFDSDKLRDIDDTLDKMMVWIRYDLNLTLGADWHPFYSREYGYVISFREYNNFMAFKLKWI